MLERVLGKWMRPGHADQHNEVASLLDMHLARPVSPTDSLDGHTELHNQIREHILALQARAETAEAEWHKWAAGYARLEKRMEADHD